MPQEVTQTVTIQKEKDLSRIDALRTELQQTVTEKTKTKQKRAFAGNITRLKYVSATFNIDCEVRFAPVTSEVLEETRTIVHEAHLPDGSVVPVRRCKTPKTREAWLDIETESKEYPENQVKHFEIIHATKEKTEIGDHLARNVTLEVVKTIPLTEVEEWLVEDDYEVWSETSVGACWSLAEKWRKEDVAGVVKGFCHGRPKSYKESSALLYPIVNEKGEFVFRMSLARIRKKRAFKHWMPQNGQDEPEPTKKQVGKKPRSVVEEI